MAVTTGYLFAGGATLVQYNSVDMGGTTGGVSISKNTDWLDFEVDQRKALVRKEAIMTKMMVKTTLAENKLYNLRVAWSMASSALNSSSSSLMLLESLGTEEHVLLIKGPTHTVPTAAPVVNYDTRNYQLNRAVALANSEIALNRATPTNTPVEFECLIDTAATPARWGDIWDADE